MLLLKCLLIITAWGLLAWAAAIALNNLDKVVQYHRRTRLPIAPEPGSSTRASRGEVKDNSPVKPQPELDNCQMGGPRGLAASHSRQGHRGGAQRNARHQSEPDLGDASRHSLSRRALVTPPG